MDLVAVSVDVGDSTMTQVDLGLVHSPKEVKTMACWSCKRYGKTCWACLTEEDEEAQQTTLEEVGEVCERVVSVASSEQEGAKFYSAATWPIVAAKRLSTLEPWARWSEHVLPENLMNVLALELERKPLADEKSHGQEHQRQRPRARKSFFKTQDSSAA